VAEDSGARDAVCTTHEISRLLITQEGSQWQRLEDVCSTRQPKRITVDEFEPKITGFLCNWCCYAETIKQLQARLTGNKEAPYEWI
jgi:hypothetical protein